MEDFKNYLRKKNIDEIQIFLKNSSVDLLKTIAKRYKLPASTKRKELILQDILQSVKSDRPFVEDELPLHVMTIPQLRMKARQLNIDFSDLHKKQELSRAIIRKMAQTRATSIATEGGEMSSPKYTQEGLEGQKLPFLKNLAKSYKIKVSKLSKSQLITAILEAEMMGKTSTPSKGSQTLNFSKMRKNELIVLAEERGLDPKGKKKEDLVNMLSASTLASSSTTSPPVTIVPSGEGSTKKKGSKGTKTTMEWSLPMSKDMQERMRKDRKLTVRVIRDLLDERQIKIPKGTTKREDLLSLLFDATMDEKQQTKTTERLSKSTPSTPKKSVVIQEPPSVEEEEEEDNDDVVSEDEIQEPSVVTKATTTKDDASGQGPRQSEEDDDEEEEVVSLEEIRTPFEPVALESLLEEPSEKQLQEELYRCLQFYEHPH